MRQKKLTKAILVLGLASISGMAFPFSAINKYGSAGGGSLVAQKSGLTGYGFTKDVMCYPGGHFYNSPAVGWGVIYRGKWESDTLVFPTVTFQINVNSPSCNFIGLAPAIPVDHIWDIVSWNEGLARTNGQNAGRGSHAYDLGGDKGQWLELIYQHYNPDGTGTSLGRSYAVGAACGSTVDEAMENAKKVAEANDDACTVYW